MVNKKLVAENFILEQGNIHLDQYLLEKADSAQSEVIDGIKWPFKKFFIRNVDLNSISAFLHSKDQDQLVAKGDVVLGGIAMNKPGVNPDITSIESQSHKFRLFIVWLQSPMLQINHQQ